MTNAALRGKPDAGNPHVRFDEGEVASAATPRRGSLLYEEMQNETLEQRRINILASRISAMADTMKDAREMAFKLAKKGNASGVFQLRGAFSGTLAAAEMTDGFLSGLVGLIDR